MRTPTRRQDGGGDCVEVMRLRKGHEFAHACSRCSLDLIGLHEVSMQALRRWTSCIDVPQDSDIVFA
jgi:hypothetical protein